MENKCEFSLLLDFYGDLLTDKQKEIAEMYYNEDMSLTEIAEILEITRQGVRDSVKRSEQILLEMETKVGFCQKSVQYRAGLEKIRAAAAEIAEKNRGYTYSQATEDGIKEILSTLQTLAEN